jgi:hypothetical protein
MQPVTPATLAVIDVYSHNAKVSGFGPGLKKLLLEFCRRQAKMGLVRVGPNKYESQMQKIFASATRTRDEFRFHRNQLPELLSFLSYNGVKAEWLVIRQQELYTPTKAKFTLLDTRPPRPEQIPILEYLERPPLPGFAPSKVVTLQPGKGKTWIAMQSVFKLQQRAAIIIKPMYIAKWVKDVKAALKLSTKDIMVIRGSDNLISLINLAIAGELKAKIIIISNATFANYIEAYLEQMFPIGGYPCAPGEFFETIGVGVRLIDEVHMDFHRNFLFDLYTHVPLSISMSGTLDSDNRFINERYWIMWPEETRPPEQEFDAYMEVNSLMYSLRHPERIRCLGFAKMYSHIKFEESILRNREMLGNYLEMIAQLVEYIYVSDRIPGQSMFVFCATVEMCSLVTNKLRGLHPELMIERYVSGDDYTKCCLEPDIVVSTLGSAGTAVDKPNARETLMTVALDSKQANIQVLSRTRKLERWPDVQPRFWFLSAREIPKHVEYARGKIDKFRGKVASFRTLETHHMV